MLRAAAVACPAVHAPCTVGPVAAPDPDTGLPDAAAFLRDIDAARDSVRLSSHPGGRCFAVAALQLQDCDIGPADAARLHTVLSARLAAACTRDEVAASLGPGRWAIRLALSAPSDTSAAEPVEPGNAGSPGGLHHRAQALQATLQAPVWLGGQEWAPQLALGLAEFPTDAEHGAGLLQAALDAAANAASQGGICFHGASANAPVLRQWQLGQALQHAQARHEFSLLYQPKLSLDSGQIVGVEALMRWRNAGFGEVSPTEFIPLAERLGLIGSIGRWSLHQACQQALAWQQAGLRRLRVSINISPLHWRQADLAQEVEQVLLQTGLDPACLALEITEDCLMADVARSTQTLRELKALNVEIALDDFGTGSTSLGTLQRLPIDVLNVDRSFVQDVTASPESVSVTRSIITMAHGMQMRVLALGVQTEAQLGLLAATGCDLVQGHWFSAPVAAEQIATLLRQGPLLPARFLRRREHQRTLLLVDDEANILAALKRLLRRDGYQIVTAGGGDEALVRLAEHNVDVIVSDQRMPGMSGVEFLRRAKVLYPATVRMTLSGFTDLQSIIDAVNEGAIYKFLTKPWDDELLRQHVAEAFRQKELHDENKRLSMAVAHANAELEAASTRLAGLLQAQHEQSELLAASASGAHDMLDELPVAVLGIDPDGVLAYVNRAAAQLLPQVQGALGSAADTVLPLLLGCTLPEDGAPVALHLAGRAYRALTQRMAPTAAAPHGRGRLVLLMDSPCVAAP